MKTGVMNWLLLIVSLLWVTSTAIMHDHEVDSMTEFWEDALPGTPMPPSVRGYLLNHPFNGTFPGSFSSRLPNSSLVEKVNVFKCNKAEDDADGGGADHTSSAASLFLRDYQVRVGSHVTPFFPNIMDSRIIPSRVSAGFPPLRSKSLPELYSLFGLLPENLTVPREIVRSTVHACEFAPVDDNTCVTSLEDMVRVVKTSFTKASLIGAFSTSLEIMSLSRHEYKITNVRRLAPKGKSAMTCHRADFPFAVFLCHIRAESVPYLVTLRGRTMSFDATLMCHYDTAHWHPEFLGFRVLKATPGTPVCHFLPPVSLLWVMLN